MKLFLPNRCPLCPCAAKASSSFESERHRGILSAFACKWDILHNSLIRRFHVLTCFVDNSCKVMKVFFGHHKQLSESSQSVEGNWCRRLARGLKTKSATSENFGPISSSFFGVFLADARTYSSDTGKWYKRLGLTQAQNMWKMWDKNLENNSQDKTIDIELLERSRKETDEEKYSKENSTAISFKCFETWANYLFSHPRLFDFTRSFFAFFPRNSRIIACHTFSYRWWRSPENVRFSDTKYYFPSSFLRPKT